MAALPVAKLFFLAVRQVCALLAVRRAPPHRSLQSNVDLAAALGVEADRLPR